MIRAGARLSDRALIPVRFSPLSAYAALATDRLLATEADKGRRGRDWAFVASAVTTIPSRVARTIEGMIERSATARLEIGLSSAPPTRRPSCMAARSSRSARTSRPALERARTEAATIAYEIGILGHDIDAATVIRSSGVFEAAAEAA